MIIKKMTKITLNEVLIVSVTIIVLLFINNLIFEQPILFRQLENKMVDLRFKLRGTKDSKSDVIIVGVDEKSISGVGLLPWSRTKIAKLIEAISIKEPKVIGVNILFIGKSTKDADNELIRAVKKGKNVVIANLLIDQKLNSSTKRVVFEENFKELSSAAYGAGYINLNPDRDGVIRHISLKKEPYPAFAEKIVENYMSNTATALNKFIIKNGSTYINYYGPRKTFIYLSAIDLLQNKITYADLKNKIALIGVETIATPDLNVTPLGIISATEIHANIVQNLLQNELLYSNKTIDSLISILFGLALGFSIKFTPMRKSIYPLLLLIFFYGAISFYLFSFSSIVLNNMFFLTFFITLYVILEVTFKAYKRRDV